MNNFYREVQSENYYFGIDKVSKEIGLSERDSKNRRDNLWSNLVEWVFL